MKAKKLQAISYNLEKGATLLLTVILTGIIMTSALALGFLGLSEIRQVRALSSGVSAYYAAEIGMEEALLEFKNNRDVDRCLIGCGELSTDQPLVGTTASGSSYITTIKWKGEQFTLAQWKKDEPIQINIESVSKPIKISWDATVNPLENIEQTVIKSDGTLANIDMNGKYLRKNIIPSFFINPIVNVNKILRLRFFGNNSPQYVSNLVINTDDPKDPNIDTGKTIITSIGGFRGVQRKLETIIDRRTGTILGMFDYTLYSQSDLND